MEVFFFLLCANSEAKPVLQHAQFVISPLYTIEALFQNLLKMAFSSFINLSATGHLFGSKVKAKDASSLR